VLKVLERLHDLGGTNTAEAVRRWYAGHDRVLILTDEQAFGGRGGTARRLAVLTIGWPLVRELRVVADTLDGERAGRAIASFAGIAAVARSTGVRRGKSGLHRAAWWVTPTRGNPRDSATESRPPAASVNPRFTEVRVRVKRWCKRPPALQVTAEAR